MTDRPRVTSDVTRGVCRLLLDLDQAVLTEFKLSTGHRVDVMGVDAKGRVTIVEVKSSREDLRADRKWPLYRDHCHWFYLAVAPDFPMECLPRETGVIIATRHEAAISVPAAETPLNANRRHGILLRFARQAAFRLSGVGDQTTSPT